MKISNFIENSFSLIFERMECWMYILYLIHTMMSVGWKQWISTTMALLKTLRMLESRFEISNSVSVNDYFCLTIFLRRNSMNMSLTLKSIAFSTFWIPLSLSSWKTLANDLSMLKWRFSGDGGENKMKKWSKRLVHNIWV